MNESHRQAIATLDAWIGDPSQGLPEEFFLFLSRCTPLVNVDLLIRDEARRTLLTWRQDETYGAGWHVPGGIIRFQETAAQRIVATARRELGTEVEFDPQPLDVEDAIECSRQQRGHFVSLLYNCRLLGPPNPTLRYRSGRPERDQWAWHDTCPPDLIPAQAPYRRFF